MSDGELKWRPQEFKNEVARNLLANAELVGKFVETEARRRLLAITDPDWGEVYRGYVARLIGNEVETDSKGVTIRVGVRPGKSGSHHGLYIELGSKTAAAHPFLRPAVYENAGKIISLLAGK